VGTSLASKEMSEGETVPPADEDLKQLKKQEAKVSAKESHQKLIE